MRRLMLMFLMAGVTLIILPTIIIYSYQFAGPFFDVLGGNQAFGTTPNQALNMEGAFFFTATSAIAAPLGVAIYLFMKRRRRGGSEAVRQRRRL